MICNTETAQRFRHHFLSNGAILTVCTSLEYSTREVSVGWSIFNPNDRQWIRKYGNAIARQRLNYYPIKFSLTQDEPILCDYISMKALLLLIGVSGYSPKEDHEKNEHPSCIPKETRMAIQFEMIQMLSLLGQRVHLPPITMECDYD